MLTMWAFCSNIHNHIYQCSPVLIFTMPTFPLHYKRKWQNRHWNYWITPFLMWYPFGTVIVYRFSKKWIRWLGRLWQSTTNWEAWNNRDSLSIPAARSLQSDVLAKPWSVWDFRVSSGFWWFWHFLVCNCITLISASVFMWWFPCVSQSWCSHLLVRTPVILD